MHEKRAESGTGQVRAMAKVTDSSKPTNQNQYSIYFSTGQSGLCKTTSRMIGGAAPPCLVASSFPVDEAFMISVPSAVLDVRRLFLYDRRDCADED